MACPGRPKTRVLKAGIANPQLRAQGAELRDPRPNKLTPTPRSPQPQTLLQVKPCPVSPGGRSPLSPRHQSRTLWRLEFWVPSGLGQVAFLSPRAPYRPAPLSSQPSPEAPSESEWTGSAGRGQAASSLPHLPALQPPPTQAGSRPLSVGTQATHPWPAEQPGQHSVMDGPVHPCPGPQNPWGHCPPHQAGPQLPGVGREAAGEARREQGRAARLAAAEARSSSPVQREQPLPERTEP